MPKETAPSTWEKRKTPTLTITTPADVWMKISRGELSGPDAMARGLYQVEGDLGLLMNFSNIFDGEKAGPIQVTDKRPGGPLRLNGMTWLQVAFVPWIYFWIFFNGSHPTTDVLVPFLLSLVIVAYRAVFDRPTFLETGTLVFFALAGLLTVVDHEWFPNWGSIISSIYIGALWFASILFPKIPLCGEYSKWNYTDRLHRTTLFVHPNAVISLVWGWQFQVAALLGLAACYFDTHRLVLTVIRYLLLVPAMIFTVTYVKGSDKRFIANIDRSLVWLRIGGWAGLGFAAALAVSSLFWPIPA